MPKLSTFISLDAQAALAAANAPSAGNAFATAADLASIGGDLRYDAAIRSWVSTTGDATIEAGTWGLVQTTAIGETAVNISIVSSLASPPTDEHFGLYVSASIAVPVNVIVVGGLQIMGVDGLFATSIVLIPGRWYEWLFWEDVWGMVAGGNQAVGGDSTGTLGNLTNTQARGLKSATTTVSVSAATAPSSGQVLTATGSSTATWQTPSGSGLGDVVGPAFATSGRVVVYNGTTGKLVQNGTKLEADLATGPASSTSGNLPSFNGTGGKTLQDSGVAAANVVQSTRTLTASTGLTGGGDLSANRSFAVSYGTSSGTALQGNQAAGGDSTGTLDALTNTQARGLKSATTTVSVSAATAPSTGQALIATGSTTATWQSPSTDLGGTWAAPTVTQARGLKSATTTVSVSAATAPSSGQVLTATSSTVATWQTPSGGGVVIPGTNGFRMSTDGSSTDYAGGEVSDIYLAPLYGDVIALYDGAAWQYLQAVGAATYTLSGRTADLPFDIFAYNNSGTLTLEVVNWTNRSSRGSAAITSLNGVLVKNSNHTRRYIGTCRPASATTYIVRTGGYTVATGAMPDSTGPVRFDLWNMDNRVTSTWSYQNHIASWNYTTATLREVNGESNTGFQAVWGAYGSIGEQPRITAQLVVASSNSSGSPVDRVAGLGFYNDLTFVATWPNSHASVVGAGNNIKLQHLATLGDGSWLYSGSGCVLCIPWVEWSAASGTTTWYGYDSTSGAKGGMSGTWEW